MTNVIKLRFSEHAKINEALCQVATPTVVQIAEGMRTKQKEQLREDLLSLIEKNANLPRHDLLSEFTGCVVVIEAGVYGWRK